MSRLLSFRPLLAFWGMVIVLLAGGAIGLQSMGPLRATRHGAGPAQDGAVARGKPALPRPPPAPPSAGVAVPARLPPGTANPAPALTMTAASIPEPDPSLLEAGTALQDRMLPRRSGGRMAAQVYAAAFDPSERHPRVALVIDGGGLDRALTGQLIASLPAAVDLAFSAYTPAPIAAVLARQARAQGRECLVSIPMEPSGFPMQEEGNRALLIGAGTAQNRENLEWALSNVAGCVGATAGSDGLNGERFAESSQAFADMLDAIARRGLIYLDTRPSAAPTLSTQTRTVHVDRIVDRAPGPGEAADAQTIDRNLALLEGDAARHGSAIGLAGPPRPVLLDRIAVWVHGLAARGIVLAPVTAIARQAPP